MTKKTKIQIVVGVSWLLVSLWLAVLARQEKYENEKGNVDYRGNVYFADTKIRGVTETK